MKTILAAALGACLALGAAPAAVAQDAAAQAYAQQKVAYHVNGNGGEGDRAYLGALRNAQNHINAVGEGNVDLVVVMHGNGLGLLANALENDALKTAIASLKGQGVRFQVCNNTLVGRNIDWENDLYDVWEEDIVPSGVAQLSHLQQQGFTYLKP
ncbi:DsrE family protein [Jannaschia sp. W003]|uniref:DsrE family protein n=1 Tax=Jannaschia sp. W003 TaxID=2867012 RepID=UPI0021A5A24A|nr:DsrE family protein [Jannaschia sp. W003]UWQ22416.1 DsrE family protein [Jannaschia sp. W003]